MPAPPPAMRFVAAEAGFLPAGPAVVLADMVGFVVGEVCCRRRSCSCEREPVYVDCLRLWLLGVPIPSIPVDDSRSVVVFLSFSKRWQDQNQTMQGKMVWDDEEV